MPFPRTLGLLLASAITLSGCHKSNADDPVNPNPLAGDTTGSTLELPVVGEAVRHGDLVLSVNATGQIQTDAITALKAETGGTVMDVLVRAGDHVKAGQPLVRIDSVPLQLDLRAAQAQLDNANLNYQVEISTDSLSTGEPASPARRKYLRAKYNIDGAEVNLEKARLNLQHAVVTAPYDGMIQKVSVAGGDRIGAGQDVATIVDLTHLRVEAQVLEHDLPLVKVGGDAQVSVVAIPDRVFRGTIAAILPVVDSTTRAGKALIRLNGQGELRPGMYIEARLEANRLHDRVVVPAKAVIEREGRPLVFVYDSGRANWVYITPGHSNGRETEVLPDSASGLIPLKAGDIVITDGQLTLTHQAPVKLVAKRESDQ
jgi:membrane fusion protein (multidrug efflux system)